MSNQYFFSQRGGQRGRGQKRSRGQHSGHEGQRKPRKKIHYFIKDSAMGILRGFPGCIINLGMIPGIQQLLVEWVLTGTQTKLLIKFGDHQHRARYLSW